MPVVDDDEPVDPPQMQPGPNNPNNPNAMIPAGMIPNGMNPNNPQGLPNIPAMQGPANGQPVLTAPRPGMMLPAPPTGQPNPYGPGQVPPFVRPPGGPGGGPGGA